MRGECFCHRTPCMCINKRHHINLYLEAARHVILMLIAILSYTRIDIVIESRILIVVNVPSAPNSQNLSLKLLKSIWNFFSTSNRNRSKPHQHLMSQFQPLSLLMSFPSSFEQCIPFHYSWMSSFQLKLQLRIKLHILNNSQSEREGVKCN